MKKQVILNSFSAIFSKVGKLAVGFLTVPLFFETLGKEGYSLVVLLSSIIGLSMLLEFGIKAGLTRFYTKSLVSSNYIEFNAYFSTALLIYFSIWLATSSIIWIFGNLFFIEYLELSPIFKNDIRVFLILYVIPSLLFNFISPNFGAILSSLHRFDLVSYRELFVTIISYPVYYFALKVLNGGVWAWVIVSLIFQLFNIVLLISLSKKLVPTLRIHISSVCFSYTKDIFSFGLITFIGGVSRRLKIDSDPFLISVYANPASVSVYRSGVTMPGHTRPIIGAFSSQLYTVATAIYEEGKTSQLHGLLEKGSKYTLLLGVLMLCFFLFFANIISQFWLGNVLSKDDLSLVVLCMKGMALIDFCFYLEGTSYSILYGINKLRFMTFTDFFLALSNIIASVLLLKFTDYPFPVVLLPTIIIEGLARPFYFYYTAKTIQYNIEKVWSHIYCPVLITLLGCVTNLIILWLFMQEVNLSDLEYLFIGSFILFFSWLYFTFTFSMNMDEKKEINKFIVKIITNFK